MPTTIHPVIPSLELWPLLPAVAGIYITQTMIAALITQVLPTLPRNKGSALEMAGVMSKLLCVPWGFRFIWAALAVAGANLNYTGAAEPSRAFVARPVHGLDSRRTTTDGAGCRHGRHGLGWLRGRSTRQVPARSASRPVLTRLIGLIFAVQGCLWVALYSALMDIASPLRASIDFMIFLSANALLAQHLGYHFCFGLAAIITAIATLLVVCQTCPENLSSITKTEAPHVR